MSMASLATRLSMTPSRQLPGRIFVAGKGQKRSHAVNLVFEEPAPLVLQDNEHIVSYCTYISWTLYRFAVPFLVCAEVPVQSYTSMLHIYPGCHQPGRSTLEFESLQWPCGLCLASRLLREASTHKALR